MATRGLWHTITHPLAGVEKPGQVWSWISFDVANQSFTLLINTMFFSIFFKEVVVRDPAKDDQLWSLLFASSMLLVVVASPFAGAMADARAWKKASLIVTGVVCAIATCALALIGPGQLWLAAALYIPANFAFNLGENFLASFLPELAKREDFGRVSGFSWGVAYASALFMLIVTAISMKMLGLMTPSTWRPIFVAAGVWFLAFIVPTLLFLKERAAPTLARGETHNVIAESFRRLARTTREASKFRDLFMLLLASFFYGGGMSVVITFASIIATDFGFTDVQLVIFTAVITVSGVLGTLVPTLLQDKLGHKRTTVMLLALWLGTCAYLAWIAQAHASVPVGAHAAQWPVWLAGNLLGFGLGSLGSANRAFFGFLTPPSRSAEFFGLWGLVFKLAAVLVIPFGVAKDHLGMAPALLVLAGMIFVGLILTLCINERRGAAAAMDAQPQGGGSMP